AVEQVGPAEEGVGGVEGAEARPRGGDADVGRLADLADEGDDLLLQVARVERLPPRLLGHRQVAVHPGLVVDAVDRKDAHPSGVDRLLDRADQAEALVLQEVRGGGGKEQQRGAPVAVGDDGHVLPQARAVPARDLTMSHSVSSPPGARSPAKMSRRRITPPLASGDGRCHSREPAKEGAPWRESPSSKTAARSPTSPSASTLRPKAPGTDASSTSMASAPSRRVRRPSSSAPGRWRRASASVPSTSRGTASPVAGWPTSP